MSTVDAFAVATYGLRLDRCSTCLPKSSVLPFGSVSVAQKTMAQLLSVLKISQLLPDATEMPLSTVRLTLAAPISSEKMTAADVRRAMADTGLLPPGVNVVLFFKDDEGDFVTLPSSEVVWPSCCIFKDVLKAWFVEAPATPPSSTVCASLGPHAHQPPKKLPCACFGPHVHQPPKKKLATLDEEGFQGYSLLALTKNNLGSPPRPALPTFSLAAGVRVDQSMRTATSLAAGVRVDRGSRTPLTMEVSPVPLQTRL